MVCKNGQGGYFIFGERVISRKDLLNVLAVEINGYELEIAINNYMLKNKKTVFWIPSSAFNTFKIKKLGVTQGLKEELKMFINIVSYAGIINYVRQIKTFATKRLQIKDCKPTIEVEEKGIKNLM